MGAGAAALGMQLASTAGSIGLQNQRSHKEYKRTKTLQQRQFQNQQELNIQGQALGMKTWMETNYGPQMEQMKAAGLNPGLMYGMGSGGSGSTATPSGGGAGGANAPKQIGIEGILSAAAIKSQIELTKAQTIKTKVEADKIEGVDTRGGEQAILGGEADVRLKDITGKIAQAKSVDELKTLAAEAKVKEGTSENEIKLLEQEVIKKGIEIEAANAGIKLTEEQTRKIAVELVQGWQKLHIGWRELSVHERANKIKTFEAQWKERNPSIMQIGGNLYKKAGDIIKAIEGKEMDKRVWEGVEPKLK